MNWSFMSSMVRPMRRARAAEAARPAPARSFLPHPLEPRTLLAAAPPPSPALQAAPTVQIVIDYSLDTNQFFDTQAKRDLLQQAADSVVKWFRDDLLAIDPAGADTWDAVLDHPGTGQQHTIPNPTIGADQVLLFAGGRDMDDALGRGGPGGYQARGSAAWRDRVAMRGQPTSGGTEFGPWGGAITFDTNPASPWYFGQSTSGLSGSNDFLSVAAHEVAHLLGFGTSEAWNESVVGATNTFSGPASVALYDGDGNVPLHDDDSHWANGLRDDGRPVGLDPLITVGTRNLLTPLDYAGLDDIGWSMPPRAAPTLTSVTRPGAAGREVVVTYSHYAKLDTASFAQGGDVYAVSPAGVAVPATYSRTALSTDGTSADVTYVLPPPGGAWDAADNGTWSLALNDGAVLSTSGEAVAGGTLGTFTVDVADAPVGTLQPPADPAPGAAPILLTVVYTDAVAVDPASIDVNDLTVTGPTGEALTVLTAAVDSAAPASPRIVTYTVAPPGGISGSWDPADDGVYTVAVRAGEVTDTSGNASAAAVAGTFEVSLGALPLDARTPVTFTDASGDVVKVTLRGPGSGRVRFAAVQPTDASAIELEGTTAGSTLTVTGAKSGTSVGDIVVNGSLKGLNGKTLSLLGDLTVGGSLGMLRLAATAARSTISAASVAKANVSLFSGELRATDYIGNLTARQISGARVYAGVRENLGQSLPASIADYSNPAAFIRGVVSKSFADSYVAAPSVGKVSMGSLVNGGVAGDRIASVSGRHSAPPAPPLRLRNLDAPSSQVLGLFTVLVV